MECWLRSFSGKETCSKQASAAFFFQQVPPSRGRGKIEKKTRSLQPADTTKASHRRDDTPMTHAPSCLHHHLLLMIRQRQLMCYGALSCLLPAACLPRNHTKNDWATTNT